MTRAPLRFRAVASSLAAAAWIGLSCLFRWDSGERSLGPQPRARALERPAAEALQPSAAKVPVYTSHAAVAATTDFGPGDHPHPLTPERRAIQRELQLVGALNDALDSSDPVALRAVLSEYVREFPDDPNALQPGYELIARCLENGPDTLRAAAEEYYARERASILRRYVRRHCLERSASVPQ